MSNIQDYEFASLDGLPEHQEPVPEPDDEDGWEDPSDPTVEDDLYRDPTDEDAIRDGEDPDAYPIFTEQGEA